MGRWFKFLKKKDDLAEPKYWYLGNQIITKELNGRSHATDFIYGYHCFFDGMTYFLWMDSVTSRSDNIVEVHIGRTDGKYNQNNRVEIHPVTDEYQKIKTVMEMIKDIRKGG